MHLAGRTGIQECLRSHDLGLIAIELEVIVRYGEVFGLKVIRVESPRRGKNALEMLP